MANQALTKYKEDLDRNHTETNSLEGEVLTPAFTSRDESDGEGQKIHKKAAMAKSGTDKVQGRSGQKSYGNQ